MPLTKVDTNMSAAQKRNACIEQKFHFRSNIINENTDSECHLVEMSVNEIINGSSSSGFPGMIPLVRQYLSHMQMSQDTKCTIDRYIELIGKRASGELMTAATWMRKFVMSHPAYKKDSVVNDEINYDLMWRVQLISSGEVECLELLPPSSLQTKSNFI